MGLIVLGHYLYSQECGGISINDFLFMIKDFAARMWWQWNKKQGELWSKIWKVKYSIQIPKEELIRLNEDFPSSMIWNNALANKDLVQYQYLWEIRSREQTLF
jgi:hypothetical protein